MSKLIPLVVLLWWCFTRAKAWDFTRHISLKANQVNECSRYCQIENNCYEWEIHFAGRKSSGKTESVANISTSERIDVNCILLSREMMEIMNRIPFIREENLKRISGRKSFYEDYSRLSSKLNSAIHTQSLIDQTIALDSSTLLNFPQHFVTGCSYTLSVWVWIWRPYNGESVDKVIFNTKEVHPKVSEDPPLLPSIVNNIGGNSDQFFFLWQEGKIVIT